MELSRIKKTRIKNVSLLALLVIICSGPAFITSHHLLDALRMISFTGWLFILFICLVVFVSFLGYMLFRHLPDIYSDESEKGDIRK